MHHIYHTRGLILSSRNIGESNKMFSIYTREMGLVRAVAQGIRLNKSKLRFTLQDLSYINVDLVRGKEIWRITSAKHISSFSVARGNYHSLVLIARVSKLIERLCPGEIENEDIFDDLIEALNILNNDNVSDNLRDALELHLVLRMMNNLGYIGDLGELTQYLSTSFNNSNIESLLKERRFIINHINKALTESQL